VKARTPADVFGVPGGHADECWTGLGHEHGNGYRRIWIGGRKHYLHRASYEFFAEQALGAAFVDHTCHNVDRTCAGGATCPHRACWNPAHLEAVTNEVNILRGMSPPARNSRKEKCPACGAGYTPDGRYRRCRACRQRKRKDTKRLGIGRAQNRTHCPQNHPYDEANTRLRLREDGSVIQRVCRECGREEVRARRRKAGSAK